MSRTYPDVDPMTLEPHYCRHVEAMTAEGLHEKSEIAAQLAWRDQEIERLRALVRRAVDVVPGLERWWHIEATAALLRGARS